MNSTYSWHAALYPLQGACIAALDMFKQMVHELAEMRTEKRACDENILELATKHSHEAAKVHRHVYVHLCITTVSTVYCFCTPPHITHAS